MKKRGILFVLLVILTVNSLSLQQLFKVPVLIVHFFEHQERNESITFLEFLSMHYWGNDIDDNDQDRDMQLPFKKADLDHSSQTFFMQLSTELVAEHFSLESVYTVLEPQHHTSSHSGSLFKPPRLV